ncbi:unnamed protein product [Sphagnum jensenii]|uniref:Uncharacterized protein n=1 Tax=Sphagnum jensenii TaxID=128206 RepID=A0ABP1BXT1_9BRYO
MKRENDYREELVQQQRNTKEVVAPSSLKFPKRMLLMKQKTGHLEQSLKAAIEIHKLEVEALRAESLAEAAEKETHQWVRTVVTKGWSY